MSNDTSRHSESSAPLHGRRRYSNSYEVQWYFDIIGPRFDTLLWGWLKIYDLKTPKDISYNSFYLNKKSKLWMLFVYEK